MLLHCLTCQCGAEQQNQHQRTAEMFKFLPHSETKYLFYQRVAAIPSSPRAKEPVRAGRCCRVMKHYKTPVGSTLRVQIAVMF